MSNYHITLFLFACETLREKIHRMRVTFAILFIEQINLRRKFAFFNYACMCAASLFHKFTTFLVFFYWYFKFENFTKFKKNIFTLTRMG